MASLIIVGGGMQGLFLLHEAVTRGIDAVLFTKGDVGDGETHHSHGMMTGGTWCSAEPNFEELASSYKLTCQMFPEGIEKCRFICAADPSGPSPFSIDALGPFWKSHNLNLNEITSAELPAEFANGFESLKKKVFESKSDSGFKDTAITGALLSRYHDKIFQGELVEIELNAEKSHVTSVTFKSAKDGNVAKFRPAELVLATGAWTPHLIRNSVKDESARSALLKGVSTFRGKLLPMIMIRGKELPYVTSFSPSAGVAWGSHKHENGDVEWCLTPAAAMAKMVPYTSDLNPDLDPETPPQMIKGALDSMCNICPGLKEKFSSLQFSVYSGYRTEHPTENERPPRSSVTRLCENLCVVLPGMWQNGSSGAKRYFTECASKNLQHQKVSVKDGLEKFSAAKLAPRKADTLQWLSYDAFIAKYVQVSKQ